MQNENAVPLFKSNNFNMMTTECYSKSKALLSVALCDYLDQVPVKPAQLGSLETLLQLKLKPDRPRCLQIP